MTIYFIFFLFLLSFSFFKKRTAAYLFSIFWFLFVGLRKEIGTDWYPNLELFERAVLNEKSFNSYQLIDSEIVWKIIATVFDSLALNFEYIFILLGLIQAYMIFSLISESRNHKLAILGFSTTFLLFFPMNAFRQGFCLIALIYSFSKFRFKRHTGLILSLTTHISSLPAVVAMKLNLGMRGMLIALSIILVAITTAQELILLRYGDIFASGGLGFSPRLLLQVLLVATFMILFDKDNEKNKQLLVLGFFYFSTFIIFYAYRYVGFLVGFLHLYYAIYKLPKNNYGYLFFFLSCMLFFVADISDMYVSKLNSELGLYKEGCFQCTSWVPYDNYIFRLLGL